jgi:hypothetical protein
VRLGQSVLVGQVAAPGAAGKAWEGAAFTS